MSVSGFGDRVVQAVKSKGAPVCVGLDPRPELLPGECLDRARDQGLEGRDALAAACFNFCQRVIDILEARVVAVKPQAAFFEALGSAGMISFEEVCHHARSRGLLVIADVKRGDIGSTATAYAEAYLAPQDGEPTLADACTVNPYLGRDGIVPFLTVGRPHGCGLFVLVKTSNPSSSELQDLISDGRAIHLHVAELVTSLNADCVGDSGYGPVGAVVGATWPDLLLSLRKALPRSILLLPGYGAQGAGAEDVVCAFDDQGPGCDCDGQPLRDLSVGQGGRLSRGLARTRRGGRRDHV